MECAPSGKRGLEDFGVDGHASISQNFFYLRMVECGPGVGGGVRLEQALRRSCLRLVVIPHLRGWHVALRIHPSPQWWGRVSWLSRKHLNFNPGRRWLHLCQWSPTGLRPKLTEDAVAHAKYISKENSKRTLTCPSGPPPPSRQRSFLQRHAELGKKGVRHPPGPGRNGWIAYGVSAYTTAFFKLDCFPGATDDRAYEAKAEGSTGILLMRSHESFAAEWKGRPAVRCLTVRINTRISPCATAAGRRKNRCCGGSRTFRVRTRPPLGCRKAERRSASTDSGQAKATSDLEKCWTFGLKAMAPDYESAVFAAALLGIH